jgi:hypothetical protein
MRQRSFEEISKDIDKLFASVPNENTGLVDLEKEK